jgi:hypothetical protein
MLHNNQYEAATANKHTVEAETPQRIAVKSANVIVENPLNKDEK